MDAGLVSGIEGVAVPLVVVAVHVGVRQVSDVTKGGVAIDMVAGDPGSELDTDAVAEGLVVVHVVVGGVVVEKQPATTVHGEDAVVDMRVSDAREDEPIAQIIDTHHLLDMGIADCVEENAENVRSDRARPLDVHMRHADRAKPEPATRTCHRVPIQLQVHVAGSDGDARSGAIARQDVLTRRCDHAPTGNWHRRIGHGRTDRYGSQEARKQNQKR
jgi:hypothetical protein